MCLYSASQQLWNVLTLSGELCQLAFDKSTYLIEFSIMLLEIEKIMLAYQRNTQVKYIGYVALVNFF